MKRYLQYYIYIVFCTCTRARVSPSGQCLPTGTVKTWKCIYCTVCIQARDIYRVLASKATCRRHGMTRCHSVTSSVLGRVWPMARDEKVPLAAQHDSFVMLS